LSIGGLFPWDAFEGAVFWSAAVCHALQRDDALPAEWGAFLIFLIGGPVDAA